MDARNLAEKLVDSILGEMGVEGRVPTDEIRSPILEAEVYGVWKEVDGTTFRSWTGRRMINGEEHHGPVFLLGAPEGAPPYTGSRVCGCSQCQEHVAPRFRPN